jgi:hypothetical protein
MFDINTYRLVIYRYRDSFFAMTNREVRSVLQIRLTVFVIFPFGIPVSRYPDKVIKHQPTLQTAELTQDMLVLQCLFAPLNGHER